jgi:transposase-like protein
MNHFPINFETVTCPKCGSKQTSLRIPKNRQEFLFGGWTCEKCACKMDKFGKNVENLNKS